MPDASVYPAADEGSRDETAIRLSIVVPVLNDADALRRLLAWLAPRLKGAVEVIVVDGGSSDGSVAVARDAPGFCRLLAGPRGRGAQLAHGIERARGRWLWLLHADSLPSDDCLDHLLSLDDTPGWGRFSVRLRGGPLLPLVARMMNLRSCVTSICTGDQGIYLHARLLAAIGGMPAQPLMEDIELCRRLKRRAPLQCRQETIETSARRWLQRGTLRTVLAMWWYRLRYWFGADPVALARDYYR